MSAKRSSRGRPRNAPAAFIPFCLPSVSRRPPRGPGWAHELKHDGYRLQIHVRDGRVRLYTMNGSDLSDRYLLITEEAARLKDPAILDAEVVCADKNGVPDFGLLQVASRADDWFKGGSGVVCCSGRTLGHSSWRADSEKK